MATTVRIQDGDKAVLDALQARYVLATGRRISLDDLLHRIVQLAEEHADSIVLEDEAPRLTAEEVKAFRRGASDWGVVTREDDIDRVLYGGKEPA